MINAKRGHASHRAFHLFAIAALGLALSACGGSKAGTSAATSAAQSSAPAQSSVPTPSSVPTQTPASAQSTPTSTSTGSGTSTSSSTSTTSSTSSPPPATNPPTATVGNVTLNWTPPTQNVDNTPLTDLAGYDIHYGTASGQYTQTISVSNPGIATYVVSNLSPGTYYFTVTAVNSQGTESPMSSEVSTTIN